MFRRLSLKLREARGIRQWVMEFVIVVFGVLLALWTQERVKENNAKETAQIITEAMDSDLLFMATGTMRRFSAKQCLINSLKNLAEIANTPNGESIGTPPVAKVSRGNDHAFGNYYPATLWSYYDRAFNRAITTGAFNHMPNEKVLLYGEAYGWVDHLMVIQEAEDTITSRLSMIGIIDVMDESTRLSIRRDIAELNGLNSSALNSGRFLFDTINRLGLKPSQKNIELWQYINRVSMEVRGECVTDIPLDFSGKYTGNSWTNSIDSQN